MRLLGKDPLRRGFLRSGTKSGSAHGGSQRGSEAHDWAHGVDRLGAQTGSQVGSETWEHLFVTAQGSAYARFRRALDSKNATVAYATALELVLLVVDDPRRFRRAALRWHGRYCAEIPDVGFEEAQAVLACLAGLAGRRPKPAAAALAELVQRRGFERASDVLMRWAL